MKALLTFTLLTSLFASAQSQWKQVEEMRYDWAGNGKPATLILEMSSSHNGGGD